MTCVLDKPKQRVCRSACDREQSQHNGLSTLRRVTGVIRRLTTTPRSNTRSDNVIMLEPRIGMQTLSQITSQNICRVTQLDQSTLPTRYANKGILAAHSMDGLVRCCRGATCTVTMRGSHDHRQTLPRMSRHDVCQHHFYRGGWKG